MTSLSAAIAALALLAAPAGGDSGAPRGAAPGPEQLRRTDIPIALVLSGGVSLGSYEAGLSWAVVRFSRDAGSRPRAVSGAPRLVAVTGASAGSINALLAAILWCTEPGPGEDSVDHNLLHDLWTAVGVEGLLPEDPGGFVPGDALLSSRPLLERFADFERRVDAWAAARRFRPGCRLPVGLTVTRATAAEHEVAGLTLRTQRFALPWRVEVGGDGRARVVSQRLGEAEGRPDILDVARRDDGELGAALSWPQVMQGMLASAAFPVAFRPRELCDCSARCPLANQVKSGTCEGPLGPITHLGCPARSREGEALTLCSHPYVDGGILDNTPVGLGVDLTQSVSSTHPLQPVTYVYIDPDLRRLRPVGAEAGASAPRSPTRALGQNLEEAARLASELVATARTENLSSTLRTGAWNATTRGLLYQTATSLMSFATVERNAAAALGRSRPDPGPYLGDSEPSPAARAALGRALLRCFPARPRDADAVRRCARELADATAGRAAPGDGAPTDDADVIRLADAMKDGASEVLRDHPTRSAHDAELFVQQMRIGAVGMIFLADEMTRVARGATPEPRLKQFRGALLDTIQLGRGLGIEVAHLANAAVLEQLDALGADPTAGPAAAQASATILAAPDVLFVPDELQPVLQAAPHGPEAVAALRSLRGLAGVGPALQAEIVRLNRLARAAEALQQSRTERALILSSRFAPIAGSQLGNFGAFLDRPLREYDYVAGVYDASHVIAVALCEAGAIGGAPRPVRDRRSSNELDLHAPDTQRCVGRALETVFRELDVDGSGTAGHVFRMLARAELDASLGDAGARRLEGEAAWAWVTDRGRAAQDAAVVTVADVLLSARVPCDPDASSRCIRELSFEELLSALRDRRYQARDEEMRALVDDPAAWTRRTVRRLVDRSYARELASPASPDLARAILAAHRVGEMWLRGPASAGASPHLALDSSTIPSARIGSLDRSRVAAHLVPYRLDLDVARGGVSASWVDPALWLGPRTSLVAEITPISYEARHGQASSSLAVLPKLDVAGLSIGAGPKASIRWRDGTATAGAYLRAAAFQQRFSVAIGTDAFSGRDRAFFFTIGVSDLNGMLFWLLGG